MRLSVDRGDSKQGWGGRLLGGLVSPTLISFGVNVSAASIDVRHTRRLRARLPRLQFLWLGGAHVAAGVPPALLLAGVAPTFVCCHIEQGVPRPSAAIRLTQMLRFIGCDKKYEENEDGPDGIDTNSD